MAAPTSTATTRPRTSATTLLQRYGTAFVLLLLAIVFTSQNSRFLSFRNLGYILTDVSICGIVAVGMTFVIISAGVDPIIATHTFPIRERRYWGESAAVM